MSGTLLIVDDEAPFVATITKRLTKRSYNVLSACGGPVALEILAGQRGIDVVILDVNMPEMDGVLTLRRIKAEHPEVEVIMLTGHSTMESALEGMKLGAFDYLMKPCSIEHLVARVEEAVEKRHKH